MAAILGILWQSVLPVFLIFLLGFVTGRRGLFGPDDAAALFKFIAQIGAPAIIVSIIITTDISQLSPILSGLYILTELILYAISYALARRIFGLNFKNALLCGLATAFANHVLFVYPIALLAFEPVDTIPVRSIITLDIFIFIGTVIALDMHHNPAKHIGATIATQFRNPLVIAVLLGVAIYCLPFETPVFFTNSAQFIADAAAPCGLFATGVLLSQRIQRSSLKLAAMITGLRMIGHPLLGFIAIILFAGYDLDTARTTLMVTAAPVGVMALTFASRYGAETDAIAQAILWSFFLSLLFIPVIAAI